MYALICLYIFLSPRNIVFENFKLSAPVCSGVAEAVRYVASYYILKMKLIVEYQL
jgi:hypothetical protein